MSTVKSVIEDVGERLSERDSKSELTEEDYRILHSDLIMMQHIANVATSRLEKLGDGFLNELFTA